MPRSLLRRLASLFRRRSDRRPDRMVPATASQQMVDDESTSQSLEQLSSAADGAASRRAARDRTYFGEELWGVSRRHRAATLDAATLQRFALPVLRSERELADWLGIPLARLRWLTHDRQADRTWHYVRYTVPKRHGGERVILAPKRGLKSLQRKLLDGL